MGQHLGKRESPTGSKAPSPEPEAEKTTVAATIEAEPESQDEVFGTERADQGTASKTRTLRSQTGLGEADANQNNGCVSEKPAVTDSTGAEGPRQPWTPASTADPDPDAATPRPHLVRLFSRDAPGREDNTFKERPSESDELQTIQEHSGSASESETSEQDVE